MSITMRHLWTRFRDGGGGGWNDEEVSFWLILMCTCSLLHIQ